MKYLSRDHRENHEKLKGEFSQFNSNDKEAIALLYIVSAVPELEEIATKSMDEDGYFQIRLFKQRTKDFKGEIQDLASLAVDLFNKDSFPMNTSTTLNNDRLTIALEAKNHCNQDVPGIYDFENMEMLI